MEKDNPLITLRQIESALIEHDAIPLLGAVPAFPMEALAKRLAELFQRPEFQINANAPEWKEGPHLLEGIGANLEVLSILFAPLEGAIYWIMSEEDLTLLMSMLLKGEPSREAEVDREFQQGFYRFFALEVLHQLQQLGYPGEIVPRLGEEESLPQILFNEPALSVDVHFSLQGQQMWGRLLFTPAFLDAWRRHFALRRPRELSKELSEKINVTMAVEVGQVSLEPQEWTALKTGDFVLLDRCSYDPATLEGSAMLSLNGTPLFSAHLDSNGLTLQEPITPHKA